MGSDEDLIGPHYDPYMNRALHDGGAFSQRLDKAKTPEAKQKLIAETLDPKNRASLPTVFAAMHAAAKMGGDENIKLVGPYVYNPKLRERTDRYPGQSASYLLPLLRRRWEDHEREYPPDVRQKKVFKRLPIVRPY